MMKTLLIGLALLLVSCSAIDKLSDKLGAAVDFGTQLRADIGPIKAKVAEISAAIGSLDKDSDGKVSLAEMLAGLGGVLAIFGVRNSMSAKEKKRALEAKTNGS